MKKLLILIALICSLFILASCGGGGGGGDGGDDNNLAALSSLNITDAKSIFISSRSYQTKSSGMNSSSRENKPPADLYKVLESGEIDIVDFLDSGHKKIKLYINGGEVYPVYILNINEDFIFVGFTYVEISPESFFSPSSGLSFAGAVLVKKSNGAVYKIKSLPFRSVGGSGSIVNSNTGIKGLIKSDALGNIYYLSDPYDDPNYSYSDTGGYTLSGIRKVNLGSATTSVISPSTEAVFGFEVDDSGNILYEGVSVYTHDQVCKLRSSAGVYKNINIDPLNPMNAIWKGYDGLIYYCQSGERYDGSIFSYVPITEIKRINSNTLEAEPYGSFDGSMFINNGYGSETTQINLKGNTYIIAGGIYEVYNSTSSPRIVSLAGLSIQRIYCVAATDNYYFIAGRDDSSNYFLAKITPGGNEYVKILGNEYQVYSFSASETDGIIFNALRVADGKKIIGKVPINGGIVTMLDEESNTQVYCLERIR